MREKANAALLVNWHEYRVTTAAKEAFETLECETNGKKQGDMLVFVTVTSQTFPRSLPREQALQNGAHPVKVTLPCPGPS